MRLSHFIATRNQFPQISILNNPPNAICVLYDYNCMYNQCGGPNRLKFINNHCICKNLLY